MPDENVHVLLERIAPGSVPTRVELLPGSFSNPTHVVEARQPDGRTLKCVVRRYQVFMDFDLGEKARREYKAFELMNRCGIPSAEPLLLDDRGDVLGAAGIVTRFVEGEMRLETPEDPMHWAGTLARMLARIHAIPLNEADRGFLLDANRLVTFFLRSDTPPAYVQAFPGGVEVWETVRRLYPAWEPVNPALVHIDYWVGNVLWEAEQISAVLDWEEAAWGDPAYDVAYARMNMVYMGLPEAAEEFLRVYEAEAGQPVKNLKLWELAASVRPMENPADWELDKDGHRERLLSFIETAMKRAE